MGRIKTAEAIDTKISEAEEKLRKMKKRCEDLAHELDGLYEEKKNLENKELLDAIENSSKTRAEILAFLESK